MRYLSLCSGIEAASVAWEPLGFEPAGFCEIEPFPSAVLQHHWPKVPNHGDMTQYEKWKDQVGAIDILVAGTPCQSFSVAGLRKGLKDPRGGLMLKFLEIAQCLRPRWVVWENVPGVLSSHGGRDFGSLLAGLEELGYGWAYRILDAQWVRAYGFEKAVPQRRRRVFVVGHLGDWESAAKVLFVGQSVSRDSEKGGKAGKGTAPDASQGTRTDGATLAEGFRMQGFGDYEADGTASAMKARDYKDATDLVVKSHWDGSGVHPTLNQSAKASGQIGYSNQELFSQQGGGLVPHQPLVYEHHPNDSRVTGPHEIAQACVARYGTGGGNVPLVQEAYGIPGNWVNREPENGGNATEPMMNISPCLTNSDVHATAFQISSIRKTGVPNFSEVAPTLKAETKRGDTEPQVVAFEPGIATREGKENRFIDNLSPTLRQNMGDNQVAVAVDLYNQSTHPETSQTIRAKANDVEHTGAVLHKMLVRRLLPEECEALQGFPKGFTKIPWRGKSADECPDGLRYKALGNSMAVNCMRWIGERIKQFS